MSATANILTVLLFALYICYVGTEVSEKTSNDVVEDEKLLGEVEAEPTDPDGISDTEADVSLEKLFEDGVESYLNNDWSSCIDILETAMRRYKKHRSRTIECRKTCAAEARSSKPLFSTDVDDLQFYEKKIKQTLCLMKCSQAMYGDDVKGKPLPMDVELKYSGRRTYEYLHICYYQMERNQDAANAVFTYLTVHPEDDLSKKNLGFYLDLSDVDREKIVDLEADPFVESYIAGLDAYATANYEDTVEQFEKSLRRYMQSEDECRLYCEGSFNQGWFPDFTVSISNHFVYCLRCKRSCAFILNNVNGDYRKDLLASHYHYLQFSYFQLGQLKEACAAVQSYLSFFPADETMLQNKEKLLEIEFVEESDFIPRKEAVSYVKRREYELRLFHFIQEEFRAVSQNASRDNEVA